FLEQSEMKYKQSLMQKLRIRIAFYLLQKEVKEMVVVYATLIIKGKKTIEQVPGLIREQVKEILVDMDLPELAG
ncbi:CD1375 family protein, partial [Enterococcus avium]|uniref:CD1375 family protein n=1 Tax=Enterococcus avium TaxID=33945 RepID=UPI003D80FE89